MHHLWAKIYREHAIATQATLRMDTVAEWTEQVFLQSLQAVCQQLDIVTPVVLSKHFKDLRQCDKTRFYPGDFVEPVTFDFVEVQHFFQK